MSTTIASTSARDERRGAIERVGADADRGDDAEASALVLRRERIPDSRFSMSLTVIRPAEPAVAVDERELLDLVAAEQDRLSLGERRSDAAR